MDSSTGSGQHIINVGGDRKGSNGVREYGVGMEREIPTFLFYFS